MKERLLLKKDREQRGREKEGEALRVEEFSEGKAEGDALTVGSRSDLERSAAVCVCVFLSTALQHPTQVRCMLSVDRFR